MRSTWLVAALCLGVGVMAGKYSRDVNQPQPGGGDGQTVEFRIAKLNQVWEKAKRMQLSPVRQAELHSDLKIQEKDELQWKKMKVEGLDDNGEKEAQLRRNFNVLLAKFGMDGKRDTRWPENNSLKDHEVKEGDEFDDPRLDKLWNKVCAQILLLAKFGMDGKRDTRWPENNSLKDHEVKEGDEFDDPRLDKLWNKGDSKEALPQKHSELKDRMRDLSHGFERLRKLSHEGFSEDSEFREPRVIELWESAKRANLSRDELDSLKVSSQKPSEEVKQRLLSLRLLVP
ncbi:unnamed protein product [Menidia menidia]|uniref:(Atlantic silverside) hypothetical protein n=1 Tax=Menidia menidia TaxID=238744 RepID=A0A8S4B9B1_9TELE|nr:unnamed protein product [Menidia menidia]